MDNQFPLTAAQARIYHATGRLEIWTPLEPQPKRQPRLVFCCVAKEYKFATLNPNMAWWLPHGPDREVWIAEPWYWYEYSRDLNNIYIIIRYTSTADEKRMQIKNPRSPTMPTWTTWAEQTYHPAETMPYEASRAKHNQLTTTVEQRDGVWGFVVRVEKGK